MSVPDGRESPPDTPVAANPAVPSVALGAVTLVLAMACFSLSDILAKRLAAHLPVLQIVGARYLALALSITALVLWRGAPARPQRPMLQTGRALCIVVSAVLFNLGLKHLPVAMATALVFSSPMFVLALSMLLLRERVTTAQWGWALLGFAGVLAVADPDPRAFNPAALWPIASSAVWALGMVFTRRLAAQDEALTTQTWSAGIGLGALALLLPWVDWVSMAPHVLALAGMGLCWACAQWLVVLAYQRHPASRIAPLAYSQLVWANVLSVALLRELPAPMTLAGTALIVLAGLGALRHR